MKITVDSAAIGTKVKFAGVPVNIYGRLLGFILNAHGAHFQVGYWDDGDYLTAVLPACEVQACKEGGSLGITTSEPR
jgi:hypothetical protein